MDIDIIELRKALEERGKKQKKTDRRLITKQDIINASTKPKEVSGAEAIAPLFKNIIGSLCEGSYCDACNGERRKISGESEKDPCKVCDGTNCQLLEKAGVTCMGIEGLRNL